MWPLVLQYDFGEHETQTDDNFDCERSKRTIAVRKYVSHEDIQKDYMKKVVLIQRNLRRCLLERFIKKSAQEWR